VTLVRFSQKQRLLSKQTSPAAHRKAKEIQCVWCAEEIEFHMLFTLNSFIKRVMAYCLLWRLTEVKIEITIEVTGRRGRRRIHLLYDVK